MERDSFKYIEVTLKDGDRQGYFRIKTDIPVVNLTNLSAQLGKFKMADIHHSNCDFKIIGDGKKYTYNLKSYFEAKDYEVGLQEMEKQIVKLELLSERDLFFRLMNKKMGEE